jgi:hypothetical protein
MLIGLLGRDVGTAEECSEAQKAERARGLVFEDAVPVGFMQSPLMDIVLTKAGRTSGSGGWNAR